MPGLDVNSVVAFQSNSLTSGKALVHDESRLSKTEAMTFYK